MVDERTRGARLQTRLTRLDELAQAGNDHSARAAAALATLRASSPRQPESIVLRSAFIARTSPLEGAVSEGTRTAVPLPPLTTLVAPRGVALQLELVALWAAQHLPGRVSDKLQLSVEARTSEQVGWADLLAMPSNRHPNSKRVVRASHNRVRQVRTALDRLAKPDVALLELPREGRQRKYDDQLWLEESGPRPHGAPIPYTSPASGISLVSVPAPFWLQGWVHVLTDSEVAAWLVLRHLRTADIRSHEASGIYLSGDWRLRKYGLSETAWSSVRMLDRLGLISTEYGEGRREDGTVEKFDPDNPAPLNRYRLEDAGLDRPAVPTVRAALTETLQA